MKNLFTLLLTVISITLYGQPFEGKIILQNTYKSKIPGVQDELFNTMLGSKQEYMIKGGDYKSISNGTLTQWQLYINGDNKLYTKMSNSDTIFWMDGGVNTDSVISLVVNKGVITILGYLCDEIILTCKSGVQKYYFNEKLGIDISLYKNHLFGNWYDFIKVSKSLPLKSIIENEQFKLESVATEIIDVKLSAKEFQLPKNAITAQSRY